MTHKSKIMPATSPLFCNPLPSKTHTTANIDASFLNKEHLKFTQNSLVVLIPHLLTYSQQCFITTNKTEKIIHKHKMTLLPSETSDSNYSLTHLIRQTWPQATFVS